MNQTFWNVCTSLTLFIIIVMIYMVGTNNVATRESAYQEGYSDGYAQREVEGVSP